MANALIATGFGTMNMAIPALISKKAQLEEQGIVLGVAGPVVSIANIPGPLLGGLIIDLGFEYSFLYICLYVDNICGYRL